MDGAEMDRAEMDGAASGDATVMAPVAPPPVAPPLVAPPPVAPPPVADAAGPVHPTPPSLSEDVRASLLLLATVAGFALSVVLAVVLLTSPR